MLVDGVSKNGNLLLNVGPTARGNFDPRAVQALQGIGDWMDLHARSIYGARPARSHHRPTSGYTQRATGSMSTFSAGRSSTSTCPISPGRSSTRNCSTTPRRSASRHRPAVRAQNTGVGGQPPGTLTPTLPIRRPEVAVPVVELFLSEPQAS